MTGPGGLLLAVFHITQMKSTLGGKPKKFEINYSSCTGNNRSENICSSSRSSRVEEVEKTG
jgi:hypothetical protein